MEKTFNTKYGEVSLRGAMIDTNGTDLVDGIEVKIDGEFIGEILNETFNQVEDFTEKEVEEFLLLHSII